jgi:hypothetical protein
LHYTRHLQCRSNAHTQICTHAVLFYSHAQVDFQHAALVQKRQLLQGLQSSRDDVMKSYQGSVKIMQSLIHERKARLAATQQVYAVQTVVVQQQTAAAMGTLDNTSGAVASVPNANAVHDTVLQVELLDPLYQNTLWDQKWPRLVQAVATKVQQQGAALQSTNAVQDRVVQGYLQHFGWQQLATGEDDAASDDAVSDKWKDNRPIVHAFNIPHANAWMDADQDNAAVVQEGAGGAINTTAALGEVTNTHKVSCDAEQGSVLPDTSTPEHITKSAVSTTVVAETAVALEPTQE